MSVQLGNAYGKIGLDASDFQKGIQTSVSSAQQLEAQMKQFDGSLRSAQGIITATARELNQLKTSFTASTPKQTIEAYNQVATQLAAARAAQKELNAELKKGVVDANALQAAYAKVEAALKPLQARQVQGPSAPVQSTAAPTISDNQVTQVRNYGAAWRDLGQRVDGAGRQAMIGIRSIGDVAQLAGANAALTQTVTSAAVAADAIGDLAGAFTALNPTLLAVVAIGATVGFVFQQWQDSARKTKEELDKIKAPFEQMREEIKALSELKGLDALAKDLGVNSDALRRYIQQTADGGKATKTLVDEQEKLRLKQSELKSAEEQLLELQKLAASDPEFAGQYETQARFVRDLKQNIEDLTASVERWSQANAAAVERTSRTASAANVYDRQTKQSQSFLNAQWENQRQAESLLGDYEKSFRASQERIAEIETDLGDRRIEINRDAGMRIQDVQRELGNTLASLQRDWLKQVAAFAREEQQISTEAAKATVALERDTAKQIAAIDRDATKSLNKVSQDEAKSLSKVDDNLRKAYRSARSARERREARREAADQKKEIVAQAAERRAEIVAQAAERKAEIEERKRERLAEIAEQRQERLVALAEQRRLAQVEMEYRKQEARRAADEQIAQARRAAAEQIRAAEIAAQKQVDAQRKAMAQPTQITLADLSKLGMLTYAQGTTIGSLLAAGIDAGFLARLKTTRDSVTNATLSIVRDAKRVLGVASPSKVMAKQIGAPMAQGVQVGFEQGLQSVVRSMQTNLGALAQQAAPSQQLLYAYSPSNSYRFAGGTAGLSQADLRRLEQMMDEHAFRAFSEFMGGYRR